jgi:hypothetical protein
LGRPGADEEAPTLGANAPASGAGAAVRSATRMTALRERGLVATSMALGMTRPTERNGS